MTSWIAPQTPPDEHPDPNAPTWRAELALVRECIPEAFTPDTLRELRAREARLVSLIGESMSNPLRILANPPTTDTGIYVRAVEPSGKWRAADIAELEPESLADWLDGTPGRSRAVVLWLMAERDEARDEVERLRASRARWTIAAGIAADTFCPQCGLGVRVDEDGCCRTCGNGAMGAAVDGRSEGIREAEAADVAAGVSNV